MTDRDFIARLKFKEVAELRRQRYLESQVFFFFIKEGSLGQASRSNKKLSLIEAAILQKETYALR